MNINKKSSLSIANHIGIIMDGNRRWAKANGLKSIDGHKKGAANVKDIIKVAMINLDKEIHAYYGQL